MILFTGKGIQQKDEGLGGRRLEVRVWIPVARLASAISKHPAYRFRRTFGLDSSNMAMIRATTMSTAMVLKPPSGMMMSA